MKKINNEELIKCKGGGISFGLGLCIVGGIIFLIGVIDGYIRPLSCNK